MENQITENQTEATSGLEKLLDNVKYTGFGTELHQAITEKVEDKIPEFTVNRTIDDAIYELHFKKAEDKDVPYFNKYTITLLPNDQQPNEISQTFYHNQGITAKEGYNLMKGGSVYKTFSVYERIEDGENVKYKWTPETYKAWAKLDFDKQDKNGNYELVKYGSGYGFNLTEKLKEMNLVELNNPDKFASLTRSLEKGNMANATLITDDGNRKQVLLRADARFKDVITYDHNGKRLFKQNKQKQDKAGEQKIDSTAKMNEEKIAAKNYRKNKGPKR